MVSSAFIGRQRLTVSWQEAESSVTMIEGTNSGPEQDGDRADTGADDRAETQAEQPEHGQVEAGSGDRAEHAGVGQRGPACCHRWARAPGRRGRRRSTTRSCSRSRRNLHAGLDAPTEPLVACSSGHALHAQPSGVHRARLNALPASRSLSEVGAELGSPLLERAQLGPEASDLAVDARQLGLILPFIDVTVAVAGPGEGLDLPAAPSQPRG